MGQKGAKALVYESAKRVSSSPFGSQEKRQAGSPSLRFPCPSLSPVMIANPSDLSSVDEHSPRYLKVPSLRIKINAAMNLKAAPKTDTFKQMAFYKTSLYNEALS